MATIEGEKKVEKEKVLPKDAQVMILKNSCVSNLWQLTYIGDGSNPEGYGNH